MIEVFIRMAAIVALTAFIAAPTVAAVYWRHRAAFYRGAWQQARALAEDAVLSSSGEEGQLRSTATERGYRVERRFITGTRDTGQTVPTMMLDVVTPDGVKIPVLLRDVKALDLTRAIDEDVVAYHRRAQSLAEALATVEVSAHSEAGR